MMRNGAIAALMLISGCTMRDAAATDSARIADSVRAADSIAAAAAPAAGTTDSTGIAAPLADTSGRLAGETKKSGGTMGQRAPKKDSIIGRDSAFGPIGTIDEKGNVKPIRK